MLVGMDITSIDTSRSKTVTEKRQMQNKPTTPLRRDEIES
jgi:hypothetical protein